MDINTRIKSIVYQKCSLSQKRALLHIENGRNIFITGIPGSGKSFTIMQATKILQANGKNVFITASSSVAADIIEGETFHRWMGLALAEEPYAKLLEHLKKSTELAHKLRTCHVVIIDEAPMLSIKYLKTVDRVLKHIREDTRIFGGIQVIFCGDFSQLTFSDNSNTARFDINSPYAGELLFEHSFWQQFNFVYAELIENHRALDDYDLFKALKNIRYGETTVEDLEYIQKAHGRNWDADLIICPTKEEVYRHNFNRLRTFHAGIVKFKAKNWVENVDLPVIQTVDLALYAPVVLVGTYYLRSHGLPNGITGKVVAIEYPKVTVEFKKKHYVITPVDIKVNSYQTVTQIPLIPFYATTAHKCQGMTIKKKKVFADLTLSFTHSQAYVALSRVTKLEDFSYRGNIRLFQLDTRICRFNKLCYESSISNDIEIPQIYLEPFKKTLTFSQSFLEKMHKHK